MGANEVIGKWEVEKGLLDCWHEPSGKMKFMNFFGTVRVCSKCEKGYHTNPDYSIYEKLAPVLEEMREWMLDIDGKFEYAVAISGNFTDLPTTLRDMVAELISKGEV